MVDSTELIYLRWVYIFLRGYWSENTWKTMNQLFKEDTGYEVPKGY